MSFEVPPLTVTIPVVALRDIVAPDLLPLKVTSEPSAIRLRVAPEPIAIAPPFAAVALFVKLVSVIVEVPP